MKVLEIKNNLVKIAYDVKDNLVLSGFVIIEDENTPYVAQVVNLKADVTSNFAIVKLLFTFNEEGILKPYNGSIPSLKAKVSKLPSAELLDILPVETPIKLGSLAQQEFDLNVDKTVFENNLVICSNKQSNTNLLIDNLVRQFDEINQKTVIFDIDGEIDNNSKIIFGKDFKLPLNYDAINFIYEKELEDVDATSKAVIQEIFIELQEYTKTLPEGFIPFETFFNVVDSQYKETGITQLVLLKNKLLKYKETEVFAQNLKDVLNLNIAIDKANTVVIDLSDIEPKLQNEVISYVYETLKKVKGPVYSFVKAENNVVNKKLLRKFTDKNNIFTTIICPHEYKYLNELKQIAENMILFAPQTIEHDFASYNTFLNKLNPEEYIVYGNFTQNIPLIVQLERIEINPQPEKTIPMPAAKTVEPEQQEPENEIIEEPQTTEEIQEEVFAPEEISIVDEIEEIEPEIEVVQEENFLEEPFEEPVIEDAQDEVEDIVENEYIEEQDNASLNELIVEEEEIPSEEPVIEELSVNEPVLEEQEEIINFEPLNDVISDEKFLDETPVIEEDIINNQPVIENIVEPEPEIEIISTDNSSDEIVYEQPEEDHETIVMEDLDDLSNDELTEDDLNFIDNISQESASDVLIDAANEAPLQFTEEEPVPLPEPDFIQEEEPVPVVPVYPADDIDNSDVPTFEPGQPVSHPKYGKGVVEKMIKYGNKTLCSINFHNIGRRLLDPAISEINKI